MGRDGPPGIASSPRLVTYVSHMVTKKQSNLHLITHHARVSGPDINSDIAAIWENQIMPHLFMATLF